MWLAELRDAIGSPQAQVTKRRRLSAMFSALLDGDERRRRLELLRQKGFAQNIPNEWQIFRGTVTMFADVIVPASIKLYQHTEKSFVWQQILRIFDEPSAVMDATGFNAPKESIISHLVQVTHHEAAWDVQLLEMFPGGVQDLVNEIEMLVAGNHPRQEGIDAIVEHDDYHARLLEALHLYQAEPAKHWRISVLEAPPGAEEAFARGEPFITPGKFMDYCAALA